LRIVDDFIDKDEQVSIRDLLLSGNFPWYFNKLNANMNDENVYNQSSETNPQFTHTFFHLDGPSTDEFYIDKINPLLNKIESFFSLDRKNLCRCKANILLNSNVKEKYNIPHTDINNSKAKSIIYYVNDSDGDTIVFKENSNTIKKQLNIDVRVSPKMGRVLFFDSYNYHTSNCPNEYKYRVILNTIYL